MKKLKKMLFAGCGILFALVLFGCPQAANSNPDNGGGSGSEGSGGNGGGSGSGKSTSLIKFNISNASVLATTANKNHKRSARAADDEELDSLVAIVENEDGEDEVINVIEVAPELQDWCVPPKVVEVYKCPYPNAPNLAQGIYTVFDGWIEGWKYTDETDAPKASMLMYVYPDGEVFDVLNIDGEVNHYIQTYVKANDGNDYIKFDKSGNAFILADDGYNSVVYRFSPADKKVDKYDLGLKSDKKSVWIGNFEISNDGYYIFVRANEDTAEGTVSSVYAIEVNGKKKPVCLFKNDLGGGWVQTLTYNNTNNTLYFYNWAPQGEDIYDDAGVKKETLSYADKGTQAVGLYALERRSNDTFDAKDLKRFYKLPVWAFWNVAHQLLMEEKVVGKNDEGNDEKSWVAKEGVTDADYEKFIAWMKSFANCNADDVVFDLSFFDSDMIKNAKQINEESGAEEPYLHPANRRALAAKDEKGNYLKEVDALKYLLETPIYWNWDEENPDSEDCEDALGRSLMTCLNWTFWGWEENVRSAADVTNGKYAYFLEAFLHHKDGKTVIFDDYCNGWGEYTSNNSGGIAICNDDGVWNFVERGHSSDDGKKWINDYSIAYQLTDRKGNFVLNQPKGLDDKKFLIYSTSTDREDTDPWYKRPFTSTASGIAAISEDGATIYYYSNGNAKDLLASDPNKDNIKNIYSFTLSDDKLIYNAINKRSGYLMVSIDLETGEAKKLPLTVSVESMLSIK